MGKPMQNKHAYLLVVLIVCLIIILISSCMAVMGLKRNKKETNQNEVQEQQSTVEEKKYDFTEATKDVQQKFDLRSNVILNGNVTQVRGTVKSNYEGKKTIQIVAKFYKEDGTIAIVSQTVVEGIETGEERNFQIDFQGNYTSNKCVTEVEFIE